MKPTHIPTTAILPAAGNSTRMQGTQSKQLILLNGIPVLARTLKAFDQADEVDDVIVVARRQDIPLIWDIIKEFEIQKTRLVLPGGATRQASVWNGLQEISHEGFVLIHDGARPFIHPDQINEAVRALYTWEAVTLGIPVKDTIKTVRDGRITETVPREHLYQIQTPQGFRVKTLYAAHQNPSTEATDDCMLVEAMGIHVHVISGSAVNIKITTPEDLLLAKGILYTQQQKRS